MRADVERAERAQGVGAFTLLSVDGGAGADTVKGSEGADLILGGEAEDVLQEVWLRWQTTDRTAVMDPPGFLITATTRMAINVLRSARRRR